MRVMQPAKPSSTIEAAEHETDLRNFFAASEARTEQWRVLHRYAKSLATSSSSDVERLRTQAERLLQSMAPLEELCGYPGPGLIVQLHDRLGNGDWSGFMRLVQRISFALLANSYRDAPGAWKLEDEGEAHVADILPPSVGRGQARRPYFEVLFVAPGER